MDWVDEEEAWAGGFLRQEGMRRRDGRREWLVVRGEGCVVVWA